jgi:hypothetical protein
VAIAWRFLRYQVGSYRVWQWNTSNVLWGNGRVTWHLKLDFIQMCWILIKIASSKLKCSNQWDKDRWSLKWILTKYDYSLWWSSSGRYLHLYLILSIGMLYYQEGCITRSLTMSQCSSNPCDLMRDKKNHTDLTLSNSVDRFREIGGTSFVSAVPTAIVWILGGTNFGNRWHYFLTEFVTTSFWRLRHLYPLVPLVLWLWLFSHVSDASLETPDLISEESVV